MKRLLLITAFIIFSSLVNGQGFNEALGLRGGVTSGFEYRYYLNDSNSLRGLVGIRDRGVQLYGLYESHQYDLFSFSYNLVFYYGFGAHAGYESWNVRRIANGSRREETKSAFLAGLDGVAGVEYLFYEAPLSAGLEIKPFIDFWGRKGFDIRLPEVAFTVRYLF